MKESEGVENQPCNFNTKISKLSNSFVMHRRPYSEDQGRTKRRKIDKMSSQFDTDSDDDGGVKLGDFGQPTEVKLRMEDLDARPNQYKEEVDDFVEKIGTKRKKKQEDTDDASNPYLAQQHEEPPRKKELDPRANPYLAHRYEESTESEDNYNGYSNGYGRPTSRVNGLSNASSLVRFPRHKSTAAMAKDAEDGPNNPFSGQPLSSQYFNILKTRRNLPVHQQRYVDWQSILKGCTLILCTVTSFYRCIKSLSSLCLLEKLVPERLLKYPNSSFSMINHTCSAS